MSRIRKIFDRMRAGEDIGLDRSAQSGRQRTINPDGSYNMERKTGRLLRDFYPYHWVITTSWTNYWLLVIGFYGVMNLFFAIIYYMIGVEELSGISVKGHLEQFLYCYFFSAQSFTTVGYGGISPVGKVANFVAVVETFSGLMTFALATGSLYGRFSKPVSKIKYSSNILIAPFQNMTGMQFMVANELSSTLMEMEARVNISWFEDEGNGKKNKAFSAGEAGDR